MLFDYFGTELRNKCLYNFEKDTLSEHAKLNFNFDKVRPYHSPINLLLKSDLFSDDERILLIDYLENMLIRKIVSVDRTSRAIEIIEHSGAFETNVGVPLERDTEDIDVVIDVVSGHKISKNTNVKSSLSSSSVSSPSSSIQSPSSSTPSSSIQSPSSSIQSPSSSTPSPLTQAPVKHKLDVKKDLIEDNNETIMVKRKKIVKK